MNKKHLAYVIVALLIGAGLLVMIWINRKYEPVVPTTETKLFVPESQTGTSAYEGCYFVWATHDLPDLSTLVQQSAQSLQTQAQARAQAYGEDCVYDNGHADFSVLETDYYISLQVQDLNDEDFMGDWIAQVMTLIDQPPQEQIPGGQPGFVEFRFSKTETDYINVRVPIDRYRKESQGMLGVELFRLFMPAP